MTEIMENETRAVIALGSNLGDSASYLHDAVSLLSSISGVRVVCTSGILRTYAVRVSVQEQPVYSNSAVLVATSLSPKSLFYELRRIEERLGRVRKEFWGSRTIDLDLIVFGDLILWTEELIIPHPRLYWRHFVLDVASEIAPDMAIPTIQRTFEETRRLLYCNFALFPLATFFIQQRFASPFVKSNL